MEDNIKNRAKMFKALSDENRLLILELLKTGEMCACKLLEELNIGQSTLSHHMKILSESGLVETRKEGKWMHYSVSQEGFKLLKNWLESYEGESMLDSTCSCKP
ncbi:MAG: ArsR/SmtB family transcription factor [Clostridiaceae bacterium]